MNATLRKSSRRCPGIDILSINIANDRRPLKTDVLEWTLSSKSRWYFTRMEVKPWFEWDADQNGHQRPISTGSRLDPYTIEHVISRTFGSSSTYAGLCIAFGTLFAFIGLHLTRHGQGESKNAASSLMKAFVQLITGKTHSIAVGSYGSFQISSQQSLSCFGWLVTES